MEYTILGTGIVGKIIAEKLTTLGHTVVMGTRNPAATLEKPEFKKWYDAQKGLTLIAFADSAKTEVIFNCTGGMNSLTILRSVGEKNLENKVLIDIANPLDFSHGMPPSLNPVNTDSLGEQIQTAFPRLKVVKTLNTMTASLMVNPRKLTGPHNVFVCGNDEMAKGKVSDLLQSVGWLKEQIIDLGDITNARGTEMLLPIWLRLWNKLGTAEFNFHIQEK